MAEKMLSLSEVAEQFGVSVKTIHRLASKKDGLKSYKVGRLIRFKRADVEAYLAAN